MKSRNFILAFAISAVPSLISAQAKDDTDLASLVGKASALTDPEVFSRALTVINELESAPSCSRKATALLIESCQSLVPKPADSSQPQANELDGIKSIYAARLAVCELEGANIIVPSDCTALMPFSEGPRNSKGFQCMLPLSGCNKPVKQPGPDYKTVHACLQSLESRPQWWTSYSNAHQNAVVICRATRAELDKDDALNAHRYLVTVVEGMTKSASHIVDVNEAHARDQKLFFEAATKLQEELVTMIDNGRNRVAQSVVQALADVEQKTQGFLGTLHQRFEALFARVQGIDKVVEASTEHTSELKYNLQQVFEELQGQDRLLSMATSKRWAASQDVAAAFEQSIAEIQQNQIHALAVAIRTIQNELESSSMLIQMMHEKQNFFDERMLGISQALLRIESSANGLVEKQEYHAESQSKTFASFQRQMNETSLSIQEVELRMNNLSSAIDEKTLAVQRLDISGGLTTMITHHLDLLTKFLELLGLTAISSILTQAPLILLLVTQGIVLFAFDFATSSIPWLGVVLSNRFLYYTVCFAFGLGGVNIAGRLFPSRSTMAHGGYFQKRFKYAEVVDF